MSHASNTNALVCAARGQCLDIRVRKKTAEKNEYSSFFFVGSEGVPSAKPVKMFASCTHENSAQDNLYSQLDSLSLAKVIYSSTRSSLLLHFSAHFYFSLAPADCCIRLMQMTNVV